MISCRSLLPHELLITFWHNSRLCNEEKPQKIPLIRLQLLISKRLLVHDLDVCPGINCGYSLLRDDTVLKPKILTMASSDAARSRSKCSLKIATL